MIISNKKKLKPLEVLNNLIEKDEIYKNDLYN
jgi:hypothetical protein